MSLNLYYLHFNNYYNRIIKKFDTLSQYLVEPYYDNVLTESAAFNPNDSVETVQIVNITMNGNNFTYDYMVAGTTTNIVSRWFIMEAKRKRNGQYELKLRRDLFADSYPNVMNAPAFIEKATLNQNDPMIFNKEDMTFNQIKTSEKLLKDETGCAWVVGYIPRDSFTSNTPINGSVILEHAADYTYASLNSFPLYSLVGNTYNGAPLRVDYKTRIDSYSTSSALELVYGDNSTVLNSTTSGYKFNNSELNFNYSNRNNPGFINEINYLASKLYGKASWFSAVPTMFSLAKQYTNYSASDYNNVTESDIISYENKVIYAGGIYYRVNINRSLNVIKGTTTINPSSALITDYWKPNLDLNFGTSSSWVTGTPSNTTFALDYYYYTYNVALDQIFTDAEVTLDNNRYHLEDSPYDMFCIPYSDDLKIYQNGTQILTANKSIALNMAVEITRNAGAGTVYDVQLLPYCPVRYMIQSNGDFDIGSAKVHYITHTENGNTSNIGVILWATQSAFTFDIAETITVTDKKLSNECDMYRLCSPNWNGQFEFSAAKNNGVESFNVDCTYKPFEPYIHINPNFKNLYGQDFNDARGLVCSGEFSLPQVSNAWANFQLNNKNYQNMFDRQIQNMEVNNAIQNTKTAISALTGMVGGVVGGATLGGVGGAIGGGVLSALGGIADLGLQIAGQQETIDYTKDQFGYNLGNIQAIPSNLTKTTAITYNNKIFPVLEYYTCTETEKQALKDKLFYNGMTVMRIGTIQEFLRNDLTYIKGKFIRLLDIEEDYHYTEELAKEFDKGVFIK